MSAPAPVERAILDGEVHVRARGFIMLIVLVLVAIVALAVLTQLSMLGGVARSVTRFTDEERARAAAESCLSLLTGYTDRYIASLPAAQDFWDLDGLLDPSYSYTGGGFTPTSGDEFIVPGERIVTVPRGASGPMHRFSIIDLGDNARCLARLDDNSDQALIPLTTSFFQNVFDAGGAEVPYDDIDGAIVLTAIGLYPVAANVPDDEAYERAHARVSIRRQTAREETNDRQEDGGVRDSPRFLSNDEVKILGRSEICGTGGASADVIQMSAGACACGQLIAPSFTGSPPPTTGCGCAPCNPTSVIDAPGPVALAPDILASSVPPANKSRWLDEYLAASPTFGADGCVFTSTRGWCSYGTRSTPTRSCKTA